MSDVPLKLSSDIALVPGIGPRTRPLYERLGIRTIGDLLKHLPLRYERHLDEGTIAAADALVPQEDGAKSAGHLAIRGEIALLRFQPGPKPRVEATLEDDTGRVRLIWFNAPWLKQKIHAGSIGLVQGEAKRFRGYLEMINPKWTPLDGEPDRAALDGRLRPIYPASEDLSTARIEKSIASILDEAIPLVQDTLPETLKTLRGLRPLGESYRRLHSPLSQDEVTLARQRLAYDELFLLQLGVMLKRWHLRRTAIAKPLALTAAIDKRIRQRLPFALTPDQDRVCGEIAKDLGNTAPMNRLLQGDVGSGKTAVAAYAMLLAVAHGSQAALLSPTELLAEQHIASLTGMLRGSDVRIALLTGGLKAKERTAVLAAIAAGDVDLVVGTHALLAEGVHFHDLAAVVIDEQHRFGVAQRAILREKASREDVARAPHVLVMTATPIPRTLALTVFGDLDVSTILASPPGRSAVTTKWVLPQAASEVYRWLDAKLDAGERAYIVVPAIDPTGAEGDNALADVTTHLERLATGPLRGKRLAPMHGRLSAAERDDVMGRFRRGELDAIVATTVIEVGVDVPEATAIVIEHAERFGLAQLHQLRGRVGRGAAPGTCILIGEPVTDEATRRLEALVGTTDGFRIAELDLEIRGPGELVGARQSGLPPFRVADLVRDLELLRTARRDAADLVNADPGLELPEHALLKRKLLHAYGEALGLADVG